MDRDDLLKAVMARLLGGDIDVINLSGEDQHDEMSSDADCGVKDTLAEKKHHLSVMPNDDSSEEEILRYGLKKIDTAAKGMFKESRLAELQEEATMLNKPDEFDLMAPEHEHTRLHIEERSLGVEIQKRDAAVFRRLHQIVTKALLPDKE